MKILYIAKFSPINGIFQKPSNPDLLKHAFNYHHRLYLALINSGHDVVCISNPMEILNHIGKVDLVFSIFSRDGLNPYETIISTICENNSIKQIGSHSSIRQIALDKMLATIIADKLDIPTADYFIATPKYGLPSLLPSYNAYFVKPRFGGDSI